MNKLSNNIVKFSAGNTSPYEMFADYMCHYYAEVQKKNVGPYDTSVSFAEKDAKMHKALLNEIYRVSGQRIPEGMSDELISSNPNLRWAAFAVVDMMIETILPAVIIDSIGLYTDIRFIDWGDVPMFEVPSRALFTVSNGGSAQRTTMRQKQYKGNQTVAVTNHLITAQVDMYRVLAGRDNLGEFARRAVLAIEQDMTREAYDAVLAGLTGVNVPAGLKYEGAFDMERLIKMCQVVGAYNYNMKPIIAGTTVGLMKVLPDSAAGYRLNTPADGIKIDLIRTAYTYDFMVLPQVATGDFQNYSLALNDNTLFVLSPAADKLVRGVVEGSVLTHSNDFYDNANLTSNFTISKRYGFDYISGATAGSYTITA